tara:strand:- start:5509 stop:5742 length:234 start_codon:yes stop_codon:yes gene_type:complete
MKNKDNLIEKNDLFKYKIPYLININIYSLTGFVMQYNINIELFESLFWIGLNFSEYNQLLKIGIWKVYFQFGPGIKI